MTKSRISIGVAAATAGLICAVALFDSTLVRRALAGGDRPMDLSIVPSANVRAPSLLASPFIDPRDSWHATPGDQFAFQTDAECDVDLDPAEFGGREASATKPSTQSMTLKLAGSMTATVIDAVGDQVAVAVSIELDATVGGENPGSRHLTGDSIVTLEAGRILRLGFREGASPVSRRLLRWILAGTHQFIAPGEDRPTATTDHLGDETGWYRAEYAWTQPAATEDPGMTLVRTKLAYETGTPRDRSSEFKIRSSHGEARFSHGWIDVGSDSTELTCVVGGAIMQTRIHTIANRTAMRRVDVAEFTWAPDVWEDAFIPAGPVGVDDDVLSPADADARVSSIIDALKILADKSALSSDDALKLAMELAKILATHPEIVDTVRTGLDAGSYGGAASMVASALAGAAVKGSTAAADAVIGLLSSRQDLRQPMMMALHEATGTTAARFAPVVLELARANGDPAVTTAASLLAATLYSRLSDEAARAPIRQLIDSGLSSVDDARREMFLYAVGNTSDPVMRSRAYAMIDDGNPGIRLAVADVATGNDDGGATLLKLVDDADPMVAARAIRGLGAMPNNPDAVRRLLDIALDPTGHADPERLAALQGLVRSRREASVVEGLRTVAAADPNPQLKALAASLVTK